MLLRVGAWAGVLCPQASREIGNTRCTTYSAFSIL